MGRLRVRIPVVAIRAWKSQLHPRAAALGSNLRTNVGFQEQRAHSKSLKTVGMTVTPPDGFEPSTDCLEGSCSLLCSNRFQPIFRVCTED